MMGLLFILLSSDSASVFSLPGLRLICGSCLKPLIQGWFPHPYPWWNVPLQCLLDPQSHSSGFGHTFRLSCTLLERKFCYNHWQPVRLGVIPKRSLFLLCFTVMPNKLHGYKRIFPHNIQWCVPYNQPYFTPGTLPTLIPFKLEYSMKKTIRSM